MDKQSYYLIIAAILFVLIPLVPHMLRLRIKVLRWLHWNWLADRHERHLGGLVTAVRIIFLAIAVYLVWLAFNN
jgi:hypothetical protein